MATVGYSLYRLYGDEDALLYVGVSLNLPGRLTQHRSSKFWWASVRHIAVDHFPHRAAVLAAEREAIKAERPVWNIQHNLPERPEMPANPYEQAARELFGVVPGMEAADDRARLAAEFDSNHADDDDLGGEVDRSSWPLELKALVATVERVVDREWCASSVIAGALDVLTGGNPEQALAEARRVAIEHGEDHPTDDVIERFALMTLVRRLGAPV